MVGVAVHGDKIEHLGQVEVVEVAGERAEVVRDRDVRGQLVQQIRLHLGVGHDGVAAEPHPIEHQRRIVDRRGAPAAWAPAPSR